MRFSLTFSPDRTTPPKGERICPKFGLTRNWNKSKFPVVMTADVQVTDMSGGVTNGSGEPGVIPGEHFPTSAHAVRCCRQDDPLGAAPRTSY